MRGACALAETPVCAREDTASYEVVHPPPIAGSMATVAALLAVGRSVEVRWPTHGKSAWFMATIKRVRPKKAPTSALVKYAGWPR